MSTTARLPKWASLLLTLLIGAAFTFGGQLFIVMAAGQQNQQPDICTVDSGAPTKNQTKVKVSKAVTGVTLDATKVHLTCKFKTKN